MARILRSNVRIQLDTKVLLELDEEEVRALDGIFGYDVNRFLEVFYEKMGRAYVEPHEAAVRRLHDHIRGLMAGPLAQVRDLQDRMRQIQTVQTKP